MKIEQIEGKIFRSVAGDEFGVIRKLSGSVPQEIAMQSCIAFAEDGCGNFFVEGKAFIGFWDHETNEVTKLALTESEFIGALVQPAEVQLRPSQVISAWIDPDFLAEQKTK